VKMTNWSGHYQNCGYRMALTLRYFQEHGLDIDSLSEVTLERAKLDRLAPIHLKKCDLPPLAYWIKTRIKLHRILQTYKLDNTSSISPLYIRKISSQASTLPHVL